MLPDTELQAWREAWQAQEMVAPGLRERVAREIRRRRLGFAGALVVTLVFGIGIPAWAIVSRRADVAVLALAVWAFLAIAWGVSWNLSRGLWKPVAATTAAFLEFSILSCERRRQGIVAGSVLYAVILTFNLSWVYQTAPAAPGVAAFLLSGRVIVIWAITAGVAALALWNWRWLGRERQTLVRLRGELERSAARHR